MTIFHSRNQATAKTVTQRYIRNLSEQVALRGLNEADLLGRSYTSDVAAAIREAMRNTPGMTMDRVADLVGVAESAFRKRLEI